MIYQANVTVVGKDSQSYVDSAGAAKVSYIVNVIQNQGRIIDSIRVPAEYFETIEVGKAYTIELVSGNGRNGLYLRVTSVYPAK